MKKLLILFTFPIIFICSSCCRAKDYDCDKPNLYIVGAYCNNGETSSSTSDIWACISKGGVRAWRCNECGK